MNNKDKLIKLKNKKDKLDLKIYQIENKIRLANSKKRKIQDDNKKKLARIFLSSKIFKLIDKVSFSIYETFTIGGLIILNDLQKYYSAILIASYNQIINKALSDNVYKSYLINLGKNKYIEDRKIQKDIQPILQLIHAILYETTLLLEKSDLEEFKETGNKYFIARRNIKIQNKIDKALKDIYKGR
jgi:hypothetical protein